MKINYLGHAGLQPAIESMIKANDTRHSITAFKSIIEYKSGSYDLFIIDSQYFKSTIIPTIKDIYSKVLILGHYTDRFSQAAFCPDQRFSYIAYSQIESKLPQYLDMNLVPG
jgi:hypothetical protein